MTRRTIRVPRTPLGLMAAFMILAANLANGQSNQWDITTTTVPPVGVTPAGSYSVSQIETVSVTTGNVSLHIPITNLPSGPGGASSTVKVGLSLLYNSNINDVGLIWNTTPNSPGDAIETYQLVPGVGGWIWEWDATYRLEVEGLPYNPNAWSICLNGGNVYQMVLYFPDNSRHPLHLLGYPETVGSGNYTPVAPLQQPSGFPCNSVTVPSTYNYYTTDGTYIQVQVYANQASPASSWFTITFPDGHNASGPYLYMGGQVTSISEPNANGTNNVTFSPGYDAENNATVQAADALGRTITLTHVLSSSVPVADTVTQTGFGGQPLTWIANWEAVDMAQPITYMSSALLDTATTGTAVMYRYGLANLQLPQGDDDSNLHYSFTYNTAGWGELASMTLPTGATVSYTYLGYGKQTDALASLYIDPVTSKTVQWQDVNSPGSPTRSETWQYIFPTNSPNQSTVISPDGGSVTSFFGPLNGGTFMAGLVYEVQHPDLSTEERIWAQNAPTGAACQIDPCNPYIQTRFTSVATNGTPDHAAVTTYTYDQNGNATGVSEYDWIPYANINHSYGIPSGWTSAGSAVRTTTNTYYVSGAAAVSSGNPVEQFQLVLAPAHRLALPGARSGYPQTRFRDRWRLCSRIRLRCLPQKVRDAGAPLGFGPRIGYAAAEFIQCGRVVVRL